VVQHGPQSTVRLAQGLDLLLRPGQLALGYLHFFSPLLALCLQRFHVIPVLIRDHRPHIQRRCLQTLAKLLDLAMLRLHNVLQLLDELIALEDAALQGEALLLLVGVLPNIWQQ